jgi:hypothetical protein
MWNEHVARIGEERNAYRLLVGKPEGKRPLGRPRRRWVDSNRMDLVEVGWGYVDWTCSTNGGEEERVLLVGNPEGKIPLGRPRRGWEMELCESRVLSKALLPCHCTACSISFVLTASRVLRAYNVIDRSIRWGKMSSVHVKLQIALLSSRNKPRNLLSLVPSAWALCITLYRALQFYLRFSATI